VGLLLFIVIAGMVPGFFLLLCGLWSIWLALGRTPVAIRVPVFLLGTIPLGLVPALMTARGNELMPYFALLAIAVLSAAVLEHVHGVWHARICGLAMCGSTAGSVSRLPSGAIADEYARGYEAQQAYNRRPLSQS
jgi:hypothetical protein